ncbi:MAG: ABC transporter substrate-binding protein [Comamonadaceae bacterium]|nr:MAG: ABC transporter substrate-binding protein [Comamonadaceae bacterium]
MTLAVYLARKPLAARLARGLPRTLVPWLLLAAAWSAWPAWALEWQVVPPPAALTSPAQAEFLRALPSTAPEAQADDAPVNAGVRTRSLRTAPAARMPQTVTLAVGPESARAELARDSDAPLLLAMLSRQDFDALPPFIRPPARVGVLLRESSLADQLALIDAVLPGRRRLGVLVTPGSDPVLRELQRATDADAKGWSLQIERASDPTALGSALRAVLPRSDALIVLPDAIGDSQAATLAVLRAAAAARVPVFGSSEGIVRSGALAATVSTPAQLARQAQALGERLAARGGSASAPVVEWAVSVEVRVNPHVARSLDLRLPSEQELAQRLFTAGRGS